MIKARPRSLGFSVRACLAPLLEVCRSLARNMDNDRRNRLALTFPLSVIGAQFIQAAFRARDRDCEAAREYIAHAVALLYENPRFEPSVTRGLCRVCEAAAAQIFPTTYRSLSRREADVLQMIAGGMSNKCIARSLGIAPETVKTHVKSILRKLKARTRAQAVARAEASACFVSPQSGDGEL
jgi:DNA-binding CsgD family transcriptional regulator